MLGFVGRRFPDSPTYAVMADTGFEHHTPISAADFARQQCAEFGIELTVVRNVKRTYLAMVEHPGMFSSARYRQCTSNLKRGPTEKYIRTLPHKAIAHVNFNYPIRSSLGRSSIHSSAASRSVWS